MSVASGLSGVSGVGSSSESVGITPRYSSTHRGPGVPEPPPRLWRVSPRYSPYCSPQSARRRLGRARPCHDRPQTAQVADGNDRRRSVCPASHRSVAAAAERPSAIAQTTIDCPAAAVAGGKDAGLRGHIIALPSDAVSERVRLKALGSTGSGPEKPMARSTSSQGKTSSVP